MIVILNISSNLGPMNQHNNYNTNSTTLSKINGNLGLEELGIDLSLGIIKVNDKLQTSHRQIYACGDLLGGYNLLNIAQYEHLIDQIRKRFQGYKKCRHLICQAGGGRLCRISQNQRGAISATPLR